MIKGRDLNGGNGNTVSMSDCQNVGVVPILPPVCLSPSLPVVGEPWAIIWSASQSGRQETDKARESVQGSGTNLIALRLRLIYEQWQGKGPDVVPDVRRGPGPGLVLT